MAEIKVRISSSQDDDDDDKDLNPRAALMAMFNKRGTGYNNSPPPTAQNSEVSTPDKDNNNCNEGEDDYDAQQHSNPKIALSTMLSKRGEGDGKKSTPVDDDNIDDAENDTEDSDPRNALSAMFAKQGEVSGGRAGSKIQQLSPSKVKQSFSMEREEEEEKKETMDPRSSLMAMLNKRGAPQSINDSSQQQFSRNEKETVDSRSSLMAMLNKRGATQSSSNDSSQQQQNTIASSEKISSSGQEEEDEKETEDPRASLMAMLKKRGGEGAPASQNLYKPSTNNHDRENNNSENAPQQQKAIEPNSVGQTVGKPALKNDPKYEKYFKMIKVGMPLPVVQHAMTRDGFDASVMDGDHNMTDDGLEPIPDIVDDTHNSNTVPIPGSSLSNNTLDDGIVVFDCDGLSGQSLSAIEDDPTNLPLVQGSGIRVQRGTTYYTNEMCNCGIRECSAPCQTVIRPYPHNEFTIILEGSVIIVNDSFTEMTFRAGDAFIIPKGAYVSWKHIMTVRRLYVIIIDGDGEVGPLESLSVRRVEYPLMNKRFIPKVVYTNPNGQFMAGLTNMIEFTNIYELSQDNNNNKLLGSCRHPRNKAISYDTTEKGGRLIVSYPFPRNELLHIVAGAIIINTRTFVVGDTFLVPRGTICQWDSMGVVRVIFCSWHSSKFPTPSNVDSANAGRPALTDDPKYTKYFKMLKIGMPLDVVKHAMARDGFDPTIMDADHNVPLKS